VGFKRLSFYYLIGEKMRLNKKISIFGKTIPVTAIAMLLIVGIGSATLLTYYAQISGTFAVSQSVVVDNGQTVSDSLSGALGGETFCFDHTLQNDASVPANVELAYTGNTNLDGVTITYNSQVADNNAIFGLPHNAVVSFSPSGMTLNDVFAGNGLIMNFTIANGGTYSGASPAMIVLSLSDGRYVILYAGWGARTGSQSLQFSDTVATSTSDGGNVPVDFTVYNSSLIAAMWSSNNQYGNWNFLKSTGSSTGGALPLTGSELVTKITVQSQGANTGEIDTINSLSFDSESHNFIQVTPNTPFSLQSGQKSDFNACYGFAINIAPETYIVTTNVAPSLT